MSLRAASLLCASAVVLSGCALAMPSGTFGSTTPAYRTDLTAGAAVRVARGGARGNTTGVPGADESAETLGARGLVPTASARYGLAEHLDLGVVASGTGLRFDLRKEHVIDEDTTRPAIVYGIAPSYTYVPGTSDGSAHLVGVEPVLAYGIDFGGIYDVWIGPRLTAGVLVGELDADAGLARTTAFRLQAGGVFGIAAGFRRVHGYVELSMLYESYWGDSGGTSIDRHGFVMIPAFGLRVRL